MWLWTNSHTALVGLDCKNLSWQTLSGPRFESSFAKPTPYKLVCLPPKSLSIITLGSTKVTPNRSVLPDSKAAVSFRENKRKRHISWGDQKGELSHTYNKKVQQEVTRSGSVLPLAGRGKIFSLPGNSSANERLSQLSQWKAAIHWTHRFPPMGFLLITAPPNLPASSIKKKSFLSLGFTELECGLP